MNDEHARHVVAGIMGEFLSDPARMVAAPMFREVTDEALAMRQAQAQIQDRIAGPRCQSVLAARDGKLECAAWLAHETDEQEAAELAMGRTPSLGGRCPRKGS